MKDSKILTAPTIIFLVLFLLSWLLPALQQNLYAAEEESVAGEPDPGVVEKSMRVHLLPEVIEQAALADESIKKQIVWLDTPEGKERSNIKFLGLEMLEQTSEPQGAVIFLHGVDQHPDWPQVIKPLRSILPESGWYTFSILLPYESYKKPPARELEAKTAESVAVTDGMPLFSGRYSRLGLEDEDKTLEGSEQVEEVEDGSVETVEGEPTETASELTSTDDVNNNEGVIDISSDDKEQVKADSPALSFDDKVSLRLAAALGHVAERGQQNIVLVGYQQGAESVMNYLSDNKGMLPEKGFTVIWIDASFSERAQGEMGAFLEKDSPLLILDIVDSSSSAKKLEAKRRASDAKRQNYIGYSQVKLPVSISASLMQSSLTQRIKGWLKVNAEGMSAEMLIE